MVLIYVVCLQHFFKFISICNVFLKYFIFIKFISLFVKIISLSSWSLVQLILAVFSVVIRTSAFYHRFLLLIPCYQRSEIVGSVIF